MSELACLTCGMRLRFGVDLESGASLTPEPDTLFVCMTCGELLMIAEGPAVRVATEADQARLEPLQRQLVDRAQQAVRSGFGTRRETVEA